MFANRTRTTPSTVNTASRIERKALLSSPHTGPIETHLPHPPELRELHCTKCGSAFVRHQPGVPEKGALDWYICLSCNGPFACFDYESFMFKSFLPKKAAKSKTKATRGKAAASSKKGNARKSSTSTTKGKGKATQRDDDGDGGAEDGDDDRRRDHDDDDFHYYPLGDDDPADYPPMAQVPWTVIPPNGRPFHCHTYTVDKKLVCIVPDDVPEAVKAVLEISGTPRALELRFLHQDGSSTDYKPLDQDGFGMCSRHVESIEARIVCAGLDPWRPRNTMATFAADTSANYAPASNAVDDNDSDIEILEHIFGPGKRKYDSEDKEEGSSSHASKKSRYSSQVASTKATSTSSRSGSVSSKSSKK